MTKQSMAEFQKKLQRWMRNTPGDVSTGLSRGADIVIAEAQKTHLSGPKMPRGVGSARGGTLAARTGRLRRSITKRINVSRLRIIALVGSNLKYARIHEKGGEIKPVRARMLVWRDGEGLHFAKKVRIPARRFLRPSIDVKRTAVMKEILNAVMMGYKKA